MFSKSPNDYFGDLGLQGYYYKILNAMGAEDFEFGDVFHYNLAALSRAISDYESVWIRLRANEVRGFFFFVYNFAEGHYTESIFSNPSIIDAVHILTIHKAKGLEFPVVFIPNFVNKNRPRENNPLVDSNLYARDRYAGNEEDERRLYYTAITRSEKYLFITGSRIQINKRKEYVPHRFRDNFDFRYFSTDIQRLQRPKSGFPPRIRNIGIYPTSFSHLSCYGRCPHDFKLRHIYQYNAGVPVTFGYGTNVHNMLNIIHTSYIRRKKIPDEKQISVILDQTFKLRYATENIAVKMKKSVLKIVINYVTLHKTDFNRILETEKKFEFVMDDAFIAGQIDLLKKVDETGMVTEVEVIDFKTDRNDSIYQGDYEKQVRFYAIACLESLGLKPEKAYIHHLDQNLKSEVNISPLKLEEIKTEIKEQIRSIMNQKFFPKNSYEVCNECDYKLICPHKGFKLEITN